MTGVALDAAVDLGAQLAARAYWHEDRCVWLGHVTHSAPTVTTLGPGLYDGTAGVGLFLAALASRSGDRTVRQTAEGAFAHAASQVDGAGLGLYCGSTGIASALVRGGNLLGSEKWVNQGRALASWVAAEFLRAPRALGKSYDVIGGHAGLILGLLGVVEECEDAIQIDAAVRAAGELQAFITAPAGPRPTGFAHGVSGIALALLEVGVRVGRNDMIRRACSLFDEEDQVLTKAIPTTPAAKGDRKSDSSGNLSWCRGISGFGLARLRAVQLVPSLASLRAQAEAAAQGLYDWLVPGVPSVPLTLCHGLGGVTEMLTVAAHVLNRAELADMARRTWRSLIGGHRLDRCFRQEVAYTPGLMLGTAGVGHALLRTFHGCESVLLPLVREIVLPATPSLREGA